MCIAFFTFVVTGFYLGRVKINYLRIIVHFTLAAILILFAIQIKKWVPDPAVSTYQRLMTAELSNDLIQGVTASFLPKSNEQKYKIIKKNDVQDSLVRIQNTGILRVGYNPNLLPFSFYNQKGHLVGYDVANMYNLAKDLHAKLEFIPFSSPYSVADLQADLFDIAIGGLIVTTSRLPYVVYSNDYLQSPIAFITPFAEQNKFTTPEKIDQIPNLRLGVLDSPILIDLIKKLFPKAKIVILNDSEKSFLEAFANKKIDAVLWIAVRSQPWILGHSGFASVTPSGLSSPLLIGYMVQKTSPQFSGFLNYWLKLKASEGFLQKNYEQWILIHPIPSKERRWSVIHDVLHWGR